jgi:hypothetical protein
LNGIQYSAKEVGQILSMVKNSVPIINYWIEHKLVPCKKSQLFEIKKQYADGKEIR